MHNTTATKAQLRGFRIGTLFGLVWFIVGASALHTKLLIPVIVAGIIVFVSILRRIIRLQHVALPDGETDASLRNKQFRLIVLTEAVGIAIAILISKALDKSELTTPLIMLTVGLHFFWMAQLFKLSRYTLLATLMSLVAISLVIADSIATPNSQTLQAIAGLVSAGLLWASVLSAATNQPPTLPRP